MVKMDECVICGNESDGKHFGAKVCRACGAFFRRSISERLVYRCIGTNNCTIKYNSRNVCRACRLTACISAGMQVGLVHNRSRARNLSSPKLQEASVPENIYIQNNDPSQENMHIGSSEPLGSEVQDMGSESIALLNNVHIQIQPIHGSFLQKILLGVNVFLNSQKTLYIVEHPNKAMVNLEYEMDRKSEWNRIERYCIYVINSVLIEHFEPYNLMQQDEKKLVIKNTATKILFLIKCFQTSKYFPEQEDHRMVTHYGYYNSPETNEFFFANEVVQNKEECFRMHNVYLSGLREITNKLVQYDFGEVDLGALSYLIFALECDQNCLYKNVIEVNKNMLFEEYLKSLANMYGFEKASIKFGNVLNLQNDFTELQRQLYEFRIMGKVFFSSEFVDIWDELLFEQQSHTHESKPIPIIPSSISEVIVDK